MRKATRPPGERTGDDEPSDAEIIAMTIRHGPDYTKRHLDSFAVVGIDGAKEEHA